MRIDSREIQTPSSERWEAILGPIQSIFWNPDKLILSYAVSVLSNIITIIIIPK